MKKRNLIVGTVLAGIPLVALVFLTAACESESLTQTDIQVSPGYAEVSRARPSVVLSVTGWTNYRWSLASPEIGHLSASVGDSVVYTATRFGSDASNATQVVTVTADAVPTTTTTTTGTNTTSTTSSATYLSGTARIAHK